MARGGKAGGKSGGGAASGGLKTIMKNGSGRVTKVPRRTAKASAPPPAPPTAPLPRGARTIDQIVAHNKAVQDDSKRRYPGGTKTSGYNTSGKSRLDATPKGERPNTVDTVKDYRNDRDAARGGGRGEPPVRSGVQSVDSAGGKQFLKGDGVEQNFRTGRPPMSSDRQTPYWNSRWMSGSEVPKGMGGGRGTKVPDQVDGQASVSAYKRADSLLYPRQQFSKDERNTVFDNWAGKGVNSSRDVADVPIDRNGKWDMGHNAGHEHWKNVSDAINGKRLTDPDEFKADYKNTDNYRPEAQSTNRSHANEDD